MNVFLIADFRLPIFGTQVALAFSDRGVAVSTGALAKVEDPQIEIQNAKFKI